MQLRISRTWKWVPVEVGPSQMVFGAKPLLKLIKSDELQQLVDGEWKPVPIEESPKPEHPDTILYREESQALRDHIKNIADDFRARHHE